MVAGNGMMRGMRTWYLMIGLVAVLQAGGAAPMNVLLIAVDAQG